MTEGELQSIAPEEASRVEPLGKALLALNNAHATQLSWLKPERLEYLVDNAFLARRIGNVDAFMLALDQDAPYDSPNFDWFRSRFSALSMSTASWSRHPRAAAATRGCSIGICLNMRRGRDIAKFSVRSTKVLRTRNRTRFTRRLDLSG
jgi:hypothetical protein